MVEDYRALTRDGKMAFSSGTLGPQPAYHPRRAIRRLRLGRQTQRITDERTLRAHGEMGFAAGF
jgi:hypothetical protein